MSTNTLRAPRRAWRFVGATAASVTLVAGLAVGWHALTRNAPAAGPGSRAVAAAPPMREFATTRGQRAEITLRDGSRVVLAPSSHLRVPENFDVSARDLYLDGEAYFEARHDTTHPFRIHTHEAVVLDVGTKFVVRSYTGDAKSRVVVTEGRVAVRTAGRVSAPRAAAVQRGDVLLDAGQMADVPAAGPTAVASVVDMAPYVAWTQGRLVFKDTPLRDAAIQLSRWYDRDIRLDDPALGGQVLTASFSDEPFSEVLRVLEITFGVRAQQEDNVVVLTTIRRPIRYPH